MLDPEFALKWRWCRRYNRPLNDPLLLALTREELILEELILVIEWELEHREGVTLEAFEARHLWPEDAEVNPDGFAAILAEVQARLGDWDQAYKEARRLHQERRGEKQR